MLKKVCLTLMLGLSSQIALSEDLKLTSSAIKAGSTIKMDQVLNGFGCTGKNISPDLKWTKGPKDTKFYAITMYDPDAPTGSGWWHWTLYNIPAKVTSFKAGKIPDGAMEGRTDFGKPGYGGPCPPVGNKPHRYIFKVYAFKDKVPVEADAPAAMLGYNIHQMKIAEGTLEATFGRDK